MRVLSALAVLAAAEVDLDDDMAMSYRILSGNGSNATTTTSTTTQASNATTTTTTTTQASGNATTTTTTAAPTTTTTTTPIPSYKPQNDDETVCQGYNTSATCFDSGCQWWPATMTSLVTGAGSGDQCHACVDRDAWAGTHGTAIAVGCAENACGCAYDLSPGSGAACVGPAANLVAVSCPQTCKAFATNQVAVDEKMCSSTPSKTARDPVPKKQNKDENACQSLTTVDTCYAAGCQWWPAAITGVVTGAGSGDQCHACKDQNVWAATYAVVQSICPDGGDVCKCGHDYAPGNGAACTGSLSGFVAAACPTTCSAHGAHAVMSTIKMCSALPDGTVRKADALTTTTTLAPGETTAAPVMKQVVGDYTAKWVLPAATTATSLAADTGFVTVVKDGLAAALDVDKTTITILGFEVTPVTTTAAPSNSSRVLSTTSEMDVKTNFVITVEETKANAVVAKAQTAGFPALLKTKNEAAITTVNAACSPSCTGAFSAGAPTMAVPVVTAPQAQAVTVAPGSTSSAVQAGAAVTLGAMSAIFLF